MFQVLRSGQKLLQLQGQHTVSEWTAVGGLRVEEGAKISILDCRLLACICTSHSIKEEFIPKVDE